MDSNNYRVYIHTDIIGTVGANITSTPISITVEFYDGFASII